MEIFRGSSSVYFMTTEESANKCLNSQYNVNLADRPKSMSKEEKMLSQLNNTKGN